MTTYQNPADDFGIDLSGVSDDNTFDPIPDGNYPAQCVMVEVKTSQFGNRYVKAEFEITGREHTGRKVFENFNIEHSNPKTVEIALQGIKRWAIACGATGNERLTLGFLKSLEGHEFMASLKTEPGKNGYGPKNRIARYAALNAPAAVPQASQPRIPTPPPSRAAGGVRQPWEH